jgi:hypothetical protein
MNETKKVCEGTGDSVCLNQERVPPFHIEITGLEVLVPSSPSDLDASVDSFDSYACDSVLNPARPCVRTNTTRSQSIVAPLRSCLVRGHESEDFESSLTGSVVSPIDGEGSEEADFDSSDSLSYANDSLEATQLKALYHLPVASYHAARTSRRDSLDSYAMDSVQMKRHLPRRYSNFSDYANDSFSLVAKRSQKYKLQSIDQTSTMAALADKGDLHVDSTYNFSTEVYETQAIQGGAGRAA